MLKCKITTEHKLHNIWRSLKISKHSAKRVHPPSAFEFFTDNTNLPKLEILASKDFTARKKIITSSEVRPDSHVDQEIIANLKGPMEIFLNGEELSLNSGNLKVIEALIGLNLKILSLSCVLLVLW